MKRLFAKKFVTSMLFVSILFLFFFINLKNTYKPLVQTLIETNFASISDTISSLESIITDNIYGKSQFVELHGYVEKLMYKNEDSNFQIIKDKNGSLNYPYFSQNYNAIKLIAQNTKILKNKIKDKNTKFAYIMLPDKSVSGYYKPLYGMPYSSSDKDTNTFLKLLKISNIDTVDLRKNANKSYLSDDKLFFKTDEHWKTETAFFEFTQLVKLLKTKCNLNIDKDSFYTNKDNYNFITYKNSFLGSMGMQTGILYSGADDFTLVYPKYATNYKCTFKTGNQEFSSTGRFEESMISPALLRGNDKYSSYLFGEQGIVHILNKNNSNGPKVLFIGDSFTNPLAAFLSTVCSDVYLINVKSYSGNTADFINSIKTDFVFESFTPQNLN